MNVCCSNKGRVYFHKKLISFVIFLLLSMGSSTDNLWHSTWNFMVESFWEFLLSIYRLKTFNGHLMYLIPWLKVCQWALALRCTLIILISKYKLIYRTQLATRSCNSISIQNFVSYQYRHFWNSFSRCTVESYNHHWTSGPTHCHKHRKSR